jgi:uncharacterized protein YcsI (UPF0317 family)
MEDLTDPRHLRAAMRRGEWTSPTAGLAPGYTQANLVVLDRSWAWDFVLFCLRNPKPCPILEVTEAGDPEPRTLAPGADLTTDLPKYRVFRHGEVAEEVTDIRAYWTSDMVAFLLGCSFTFERALLEAGVPVRHLEEGKNVPMYRTNRPCLPGGRFSGPLVVSMRPIPASLVARAVQVTARFPAVHGAPVHIGDPEGIGIRDLDRPDWGDAVAIRPGEIPVFWACGVTPQAAATVAKPPLMITHAPGHMFLTDVRDEEWAVW